MAWEEEQFKVPVAGGDAEFRADFQTERLVVTLPVGGTPVTASFPLSPENWDDRDRRNWTEIRRHLPESFSLVRHLRRAFLAEL